MWSCWNGSYNALDDTRDVTRWCCGNDNACCTNDYEVFELPRKFTGRVVASSASSSATASPTASPTSSPAPTDTKTPETGTNNLSPGVKAGIGAGAAVAAVAVFLAAFFGHKAYEYRKLAKQREVELKYSLQFQWNDHEHEYAHVGYIPSELSTTRRPAEMMTVERSMELPGLHGHA
jgi:hypothetical protein